MNTTEIEVTPEMIKAGADVLKEFALPDGGDAEWMAAAAAVFKAMLGKARAPAR